MQTLRLLPGTSRLHQTELSTAKNFHILQELEAISEAISLIFILVNLCLWISLEIRHVWYIPKSNSMWILLRICSRSLEKEKKISSIPGLPSFAFHFSWCLFENKRFHSQTTAKTQVILNQLNYWVYNFFSCFNFVLQVLHSLFHDHLHFYWIEYFKSPFFCILWSFLQASGLLSSPVTLLSKVLISAVTVSNLSFRPERSLKSVIYHFPIVTARTVLSRTSLISLIATLSPCGCKAFRNGIWYISCRWHQGDSEETHFLVSLPLFLNMKTPKQLYRDCIMFLN